MVTIISVDYRCAVSIANCFFFKCRSILLLLLLLLFCPISTKFVCMNIVETKPCKMATALQSVLMGCCKETAFSLCRTVKASEQECCFPCVLCNDDDELANLLCQCDGHIVVPDVSTANGQNM